MYLCFPTGIRYTLYRLSVYAQIPDEKGGEFVMKLMIRSSYSMPDTPIL